MRMPDDHAPLPSDLDDYPWPDEPEPVVTDGLLTVVGCLVLVLLLAVAEWAVGRR